jgi:hypothetical protein
MTLLAEFKLMPFTRPFYPERAEFAPLIEAPTALIEPGGAPSSSVLIRLDFVIF